MAVVKEEDIKARSRPSGVYEVLSKDGQPTGAYRGPWMNTAFDDPWECHRANQDFKRHQDHKAAGLNKHGQTPEQEKAFQSRQSVQKIKAEKAAIAAEMATQNK